MKVNESIYGAAADWVKIGNMSETDRDKLFLMANFGDNTSSLHDGTLKGKLEYGKPIDKTLSWCGLGFNSVYSNVEYWNKVYGAYTDPSTGKEIKFEKFRNEKRSVTNFAWIYNADINPNLGVTKYSRTDGIISDTSGFNRWSPLPAFFNNQATGNCNSSLQPITQIPIKNCVLVPVLRVRSELTTTTAGHTVAMWEYLDDSSTYNYSNNPYITAIGMRVMTYLNSSQTTRANYLTSTSNPSGICVLDELNYQKDEPRFYDVPARKMGLVYAYSSNYFGSKTIDRLIFGTMTQGVGSNVNSDTVQLANAAQSGAAGITNRSMIIPVLPHPNAKWTDPITSNLNTRIYYIEYYDGLKEWIRRQIACFGLFFTDDEQTALNGELDDDNMLLGILVSGVGNGDYSHGQDNRKQPQWNWKTTNDGDYDPSNPPEIDDNTYGRPWGFNSVSLADSTVRRYVMSPAELANLGRYLWDIIDTTDADALIQNQTLSNFLTNNPLDCVVSLKYFPFSDMSQAPLTNLVLGKVLVPNVAGRPFGADSTTRSCGVKHIYRRFHDWRDYICEYFLYLPFCGTLKLDAETVVGRDICVYYAIDYTTGTCTAYVTTWDDDGAECYIDSASGNCSVDIPLSGVETATLTGELYNANENLKALKFNGIVGAAQGALNIAGAAGSGSKLAAAGAGLQAGAGIVNAIHDKAVAEWNISQTQIPLKMIGASSGCNSFQGELTPCVLIFYPETDDKFNKADYLHTVGAACCESGTIGDYKGYAEIVNADLSGLAATADEINMIRNQLSKGVYL